VLAHITYAVSTIKEFVEFFEKADATIKSNDKDTFWRAAADIDAILKPDLWRQFYNNAIEKLQSDPLYNGGRDWQVYGFTLCEATNFSLTVRSTLQHNIGRNVVDGPTDDDLNIISTRAAPAVLSILSRQPREFVFYSIPPHVNLDVFDPDVPLQESRRQVIAPWQPIRIDGPHEFAEMTPDFQSDTCLLDFSMKPMISQRWEFDARSGFAAAAVLVSTETSTILSIIEEIKRAGYVSALPELLDLGNHPDFNIRWNALRCVAAFDTDAGHKMLVNLQDDPHPLIRNSVRQMLAGMQ